MKKSLIAGILAAIVFAPPAEPPTAVTIGFFMNDWTPKTFKAPAGIEATLPAAADNTVIIDASDIITKIPRSEFGHNANTWMTPMITQPAFITPITNLHPHIIRFPAGSGSDAYFWNCARGSLPADVPQFLMDKDGKLKHPGFGYGRTPGDWNASLDDYYAMLKKTGNQGLFTVNYGYARYGTSANPVATAAHLAADWVRYDNGRTQYWEIGNENFGNWEWGYRIDTTQNKDGQPQFLTGKLYAQHFKVFADSMHKAAAETGKAIYIGAVTSEAPPKFWDTNTTKTWNSGMIPELNNKPDFYVVHNYFTPYNANSTPAQILKCADTVPAQMMKYVTGALQANGAALKPIAMDEWNMFATKSKQMVSNASGVFAVIVMGETIKNKYGMAARWDLLNGWDNGDDMGLFSAGNEPGIPRWSPRPSFYYMYFFQKLLGDRMVFSTVTGASDLHAYASTFSSGEANITLVNTSVRPQAVAVKVNHFNTGSRFYWYSLEGGDDSTFSRKVAINGNSTNAVAGGPADYAALKARSAATANGIRVMVPAMGVVCMAIEKK